MIAHLVFCSKAVFERERERELSAPRQKGIPIGNLTSQLFANIYMNEFDQFVKHDLKVKHYVRYTDDFMIIAEEKEYLENLLPKIQSFLEKSLKLTLHPKKVTLSKFHHGVDFLGYVNFPHHRILRGRTKKRIIRKLKQKVLAEKRGLISKDSLESSVHSYLGVLSHADCYELGQDLRNRVWFWLKE